MDPLEFHLAKLVGILDHIFYGVISRFRDVTREWFHFFQFECIPIIPRCDGSQTTNLFYQDSLKIYNNLYQLSLELDSEDKNNMRLYVEDVEKNSTESSIELRNWAFYFYTHNLRPLLIENSVLIANHIDDNEYIDSLLRMGIIQFLFFVFIQPSLPLLPTIQPPLPTIQPLLPTIQPPLPLFQPSLPTIQPPSVESSLLVPEAPQDLEQEFAQLSIQHPQEIPMFGDIDIMKLQLSLQPRQGYLINELKDFSRQFNLPISKSKKELVGNLLDFIGKNQY